MVAKTEVAGRAPLPRHKGLPARKKGDWEMEGRRDGTAYGKGCRGNVKERETERAKWHKYDLWLCGVFRAELNHGQPLNPLLFFTQPHLSQSTLIRTIWLKDEPPAINASPTVSPALTQSNIWIRASQPSQRRLQVHAGDSEDKITISKSL